MIQILNSAAYKHKYNVSTLMAIYDEPLQWTLSYNV